MPLDGEDDEDAFEKGSVEAAVAAFCGVAPRKKRGRPRKTVKASADGWQPRPKGVAIDRSDTAYLLAKYAAQEGMPEFRRITFLDATMFDNGAEGRKRGTPRYQIKLTWTCAAPWAVNKRDARSRRKRYMPLAERDQARDNWKRPRRGHLRIGERERDLIEQLLQHAREENKIGDGRPPALLGCLQHRWGQEGTVRLPTYGLVRWRQEGGTWLPDLMLVSMVWGEGLPFEVLQTRDRGGLARNTIAMQEGRGAGVVAYGNHHSDELLLTMSLPWMTPEVRLAMERGVYLRAKKEREEREAAAAAAEEASS